ncbi:MAG: signal peptidase [Streptosporangiaceae bacterium]|jgi:lipoprotein signal peptidase|nr:signal peptidase [Streptosporangiaceae bacterium]
MRWRGTAGDGSGPPARRRVGVLVGVAALVYAADVISKVIVVATLTENVPVRAIGSLLRLDYIRNPGAAFSLGADGYTVVFTLIAAAVIVAILRMARTLASRRWAVALGLLLGGALGNLTDRIARGPGPLRGWVVDFIQLPHWPVFNLADSAICCGGALMVLLTVLGLHPDGQADRGARGRGTGADASRAAYVGEPDPGALD